MADTTSLREWARHPETPQHLSMLMLGAADEIDSLSSRNETLSQAMTGIIDNVKRALRDGTGQVVSLGASRHSK